MTLTTTTTQDQRKQHSAALRYMRRDTRPIAWYALADGYDQDGQLRRAARWRRRAAALWALERLTGRPADRQLASLARQYADHAPPDVDLV